MRIAVLMGGESQERDISRVTGVEVAKALASRGHEISLIDTQGGRVQLPETKPAVGIAPPEIVTPERTLTATGPAGVTSIARSLGDAQAVFIALHGGWGEDGTVQAVFEMAAVPYTGSGVLASALAMDKDRAKRVARFAGVRTPDWVVIDARGDSLPGEEELRRLAQPLGSKLVVKPNAEGSTVGLRLVDDPSELAEAVRFSAKYGSRVLIEKYVPGRELTVAILGEEALPVVEIIPEGGIYDYESKYTKGRSRYVCPAELPPELTAALQEDSVNVFHALGCEGFARVDYRLPESGDFQFLEVNTIPGMTPLSLVPMAAKAAGIEFPELVDRIVELAVERGTRRGGPLPGVEIAE